MKDFVDDKISLGIEASNSPQLTEFDLSEVDADLNKQAGIAKKTKKHDLINI